MNQGSHFEKKQLIADSCLVLLLAKDIYKKNFLALESDIENTF